MRTFIIGLSSTLILLLASACRAAPLTSSPANHDLTTAPTRPPLTGTPAALLPTELPSPVPATPQIQATPPPTSPLSPTVASPPILAPANISGLEQVGLVEYSPWDLVLAVAWSPDGNLIAAAAGESIYIYSRDLQQQSKLEAGVWTTSLAFHPQGLWLASGGRDGQVQIWDVQKQRSIMRLDAHKKGVNDVAFSPDGSVLASAGNDAVARLWDPLTGKSLAQMIGGTYAVPSIAFSPDGADLAITNGELIRIRDVESSRFAYTLLSQGSNYSTAWSPEENLLASGSTTGEIYIWELTPGQPSGALSAPIDTVEAPDSLVWSLDFSLNGALLAASDNRGTIHFWDVEERIILLSRSASSQGVTSLAFSPDGRYLVTGGLDGALRLWASR